MDPDERLLGDVHGLVRILHHAERELVHAPLVSLHESAKGLRVAATGVPDERIVVRRILTRCGWPPAPAHRTASVARLFMKTRFLWTPARPPHVRECKPEVVV